MCFNCMKVTTLVQVRNEKHFSLLVKSENARYKMKIRTLLAFGQNSRATKFPKAKISFPKG